MKRLSIGGALALGIEPRRDLALRLLVRLSLAHPCLDVVAGTGLLGAHGVLAQVVRGTRPRLPVALKPPRAAQALLIHQDLCDAEAAQRLPIGIGRRVCVPDAGSGCAHGPHRMTVLQGHGGLVVPWPRRIGARRGFHGAQGVFPGLFQRAGHQAIVGFHRIILPLGSERVIPRPR